MTSLLTRAAAALADGELTNAPESLPVRNIRKDGGTQMRSQIDEKTLNEYVQMIREDESPGHWPFKDKPLAIYDGSEYWLADGFHRCAAWHQVYGDSLPIPVEVRSGTRRDAVLYAAGANADHGLRRSSEDKRRSVLALLNDSEWNQWSNREIARRCKVDEKTVRTLRPAPPTPSPAPSAENPQMDPPTGTSVPSGSSKPASAENPQMRKFERGGKVHEMKAPVRYLNVIDLRAQVGNWLGNLGLLGGSVRPTNDAPYIALHMARTSREEGEKLREFLRSNKINWKEADLKQAVSNYMDGILSGWIDHDLRSAGYSIEYNDECTLPWRAYYRHASGTSYYPAVPTAAEAVEKLNEYHQRKLELSASVSQRKQRQDLESHLQRGLGWLQKAIEKEAALLQGGDTLPSLPAALGIIQDVLTALDTSSTH